MEREAAGNIGDLMTAVVCLLAMIIVMNTFMDCMRLVSQKTAISQMARDYILRMETVGYLTAEDRQTLEKEMNERGVTQLDLSGTTWEEATYGAEIRLQISGKIEGRYVFEEVRVSTAKK